MPALRLYLLGPPRVELNGDAVDLQRRKAMALLIYLAISGQPHSRDALATLFWPDYTQRQARAYLRRDLAVLNTRLTGEWLVADRDTVELKRSPELWVDVAEFRRLVAACLDHAHPAGEVCPDCLAQLAEAAALYTDDFMAGFTLRDSPEFDDWQFFQSESLRQELARVLEWLGREHSQQGEPEIAVPYIRRWVALDPLHEPAQRALIQSYDRAGQSAAALRQYEEYVRLLEAELGLPPEEETTTLYEAIKAKRFLGPYLKAGEQEVAAGREDANQHGTYSADPISARVIPAAAVEHGPGQAAPPTHAPPLLPYNVPFQPTPFVGRERELAEILHRLQDPACRLLTLVGPGGIGKTRLAIQAGQRVAEAQFDRTEFRHGVVFVPLAPVSIPDDVISAIAEATHFNFYSHFPPKEQLLDYLREKQMLLILDNLEHLLPSPGFSLREARPEGLQIITDILTTAPGVKILATSREMLNLQEAWFHPVAGLPFPPVTLPAEKRDTLADDGELPVAAYDAVRLFEQSARRTRIDFSLATEQEHVVRICRLVEGMPLAIELATAWLKVLTVEKVADELERGLDILTTRYQNVPERHRNMRVVLEQSWELLNEDEREVLQQLSIFRGGFDREAVKEVVGASLLTLAVLVEKSLLRTDTTGRYYMHELLRQFASEKLKTTQLEAPIAHRHSRYYLHFVNAHEAALHGQAPSLALAALRREMDNIRQAWHWAVMHKQFSLLAEALEGLAAFYEFAGLLTEGQQVFDTAVRQLEPLPADDEAGSIVCHLLIKDALLALNQRSGKDVEMKIARATALARHLQSQAYLADTFFAQALAQGNRGDFEQALEYYRQAISLYQALQQRRQLAVTLNYMGEVMAREQMPDAALECHQQAAEIGLALDNIRLQALSLSHTGVVYYYKDDYPLALSYWKRALPLFEQLDDLRGIGRTLNNIGFVHTVLGNYERAIRYLNRVLPLLRRVGDRRTESEALATLGEAYFGHGDYTHAREFYVQALQFAQEMELPTEESVYLTNLGLLNTAMGRFEEAEGQLQRAQALVKEAGHPKEIAKTLGALGLLYHQRDWVEQGLVYYDQAIRILQQAREERNEMASLLMKKAEALAELGEIDEAAALAEEAGRIARAIGRSPLVFQAELLLAKVAYRNGRSREANHRLQNLLIEATAPSERAAIYYELWHMGARREQGQQALELYRSLSAQTPNTVYQVRLRQLQSALEPRFIQESLIGSGSMGEVYLGQEVETGRRVAIKRLRPELVARYPEAVKRLMREGQVLRQLHHPNIVSVLATLEEEDQPAIVMEYIPGGSLRDLLAQQPRLPLNRVLAIALELADALARTHHLGILHGNIKPANVLLAEDGTPRLTDLGVAYLAQSEMWLTEESALPGNAVYISPETWRGEALDACSDIWSFGVMLYEMVAGRPPFFAGQVAAIRTSILNDPLPDLDQFRSEVPPVLAALIGEMLVKERARRIDSIRQVAAGLEMIQRELRLLEIKEL